MTRETAPLRRLALLLLSVALLRAAFPPFSLPLLALLAPAPLFLALDGLSPGRANLAGLAWGFLAAAANTHWFLEVFPGSARPFVPVLWLLLATFSGLYAHGHALAARRGPATLAVFGPALWISLEWLRSEPSPIPFAWFTLGHALGGSEWLRQDADLAGVYGLSLLAYGTSLLAVNAWRLRRDGRGFVLALFAVVLPLLLWARGANVLGRASLPEGRAGLRVVVVQDEHPDQVEPKLPLTRRAVAEAKGPVDAIVWPEGAVPENALRPGSGHAALAEVAGLASRVFVFGTGEEAPGGAWWNAAVLLGPDGAKLGSYHKRVPVPFIEPVLAGHEAPVFSVPGPGSSTTKVGVLICYDGTFPFVARELVQNGAEAILTPSMDEASWGLIQHLEHAAFYPLRACELRRPIARACSSGVSFVLDPWGRELARIEPFAPGATSAVIVPESVLTPYVLGGWRLPHVAAAVVALGLALLLRDRLRAGPAAA